MSGWTWYFGLINFAILATALYFFGRKTVAKMFKSYRDKIAEGLSHAQNADANAAAILSSIDGENSEEAAEIQRIMQAAQEEAAEERRRFEAEKAQLADTVEAELSKERLLMLEKTQHLFEVQAAAEITQEAAALLANCSAEQKQRLNEVFLREFPSLIKIGACDEELMESGGTLKVLIASPALTAADSKSLRVIISENFAGAGFEFVETTAPELLGGVRIRIGDTVYDSSLRHKLDLAEEAIDQCELPEIGALEKLREFIGSLDIGIDVYQVGTVSDLSDGICHVSGLGDIMSGEMVAFQGGLRGMALDLAKDSVGVIMLGDYSDVQEDQEVRRTGRVVEVPVGEALLGRVVDALGRPVDGKGEIITSETRPVESPAPGVIDRKSVSVPLQTGLKAVDALMPIGRGQRELIIGDRQTGKTAIALDAIVNQKGKGVICVYVAIGQKASTVASFVEKLRVTGALDYSIVVCANASEPAPLLYIAPFAGCAMGEYFMYQGKDVLIVYDDLSKQAVAYREISLLLHRPPGREAFPGDIFYLHSRLLERAARLSDELGGGSMTALPIVETQSGDISAYIPTNVISITDGQIFLETGLFNSGVRPAINVGLSVSRVGGSAQLKAMKQVSASLRIKLAQYRELEAFSQFGSEMDKATRDTLHLGDRLTELLRQPQLSPMGAPEQVVSIFAVNEGYANGIELENIKHYESALVEFVFARRPELREMILNGNKLSDVQLEALRRLIEDFNKGFVAAPAQE